MDIEKRKKEIERKREREPDITSKCLQKEDITENLYEKRICYDRKRNYRIKSRY